LLCSLGCSSGCIPLW